MGLYVRVCWRGGWGWPLEAEVSIRHLLVLVGRYAHEDQSNKRKETLTDRVASLAAADPADAASSCVRSPSLSAAVVSIFSSSMAAMIERPNQVVGRLCRVKKITRIKVFCHTSAACLLRGTGEAPLLPLGTASSWSQKISAVLGRKATRNARW